VAKNIEGEISSFQGYYNLATLLTYFDPNFKRPMEKK
jgi:hypothetical protein